MNKDFKREDMMREAEAAKLLLEALQIEGDEDFAHDVVEGETNLFEAVERCLDEMDNLEPLINGLKDHIAQLTERKKRFEARRETIRGAIDQAFQVADIKSHVFSRATITTKAVPPALVVEDEALVPSKFFAPQPPKLDRKALLEAAKNGKVEGVRMTNGGQTIQIRRK